MSIPSPRKFIEIVLCIFVSAMVMASMVVVVAVLAVYGMLEALIDKFKVKGRRV